MSELWTEAEIAFLVANQMAPTETLMPYFPTRTLNAVQRQRTKLGVGQLQRPVAGQKWDADEIAILHQYRHMSSPKLIGFLPGRSHLAIEMKRRELGIPYESPNNGWTKAEIEILRAHPGASESELMDLIPNRSGASIMNKAYRLGLVRKPEKKAKPEPSRARKEQLDRAASKRVEALRLAPVQPPQPGEITVTKSGIRVLWMSDGVPMPYLSCWTPPNLPAVVPLALPAAQLGGPVAS